MDGMQAVLLLTVTVVAFGLGLAIAWWALKANANSTLNKAHEQASLILALAKEESEAVKVKIVANAKTELDRERNQLDSKRTSLNREREVLEQEKQQFRLKHDRQRKKLNNRKRRLSKKQDVLLEAAQSIHLLQSETDKVNHQTDVLLTEVSRISKTVSNRLVDLDSLQQELESGKAELNDLIQERVTKLEIISGLSQEEALQHLRDELMAKAKDDIALELLELRDEVQIKAKQEAQKVILTTMQRLAADEAESNSVSVVPITTDNVKGRIIGREGRNAHAFEAATGVDLLVDDTPGAIIISCFDPYRREIARLALNALIRDGRIHPASIERYVTKAEESLKDEIRDVGERTLINLKLRGMHKELIPIVGKMKYRSSYGQNLLNHSIQVARLCSIMAAEMGLNSQMARRAGLLHDIGKVLQESEDRPHALVSMDYCERYKEHAQICNAVGAHHDEIEMTTLYAPIVQICDAISGARPGARHMRREDYIERLQDMESIAMSFAGVTMAYAIQGGRELRVIVQQSRVSDQKTQQIAADISTRIQNELTYPGQVNVTVIREVRKSSIAR